jgi:hypothetical protein
MPMEYTYRRHITHKRKSLVNYSFTRLLFCLGSGNSYKTYNKKQKRESKKGLCGV